jgi:hypothetical protein
MTDVTRLREIRAERMPLSTQAVWDRQNRILDALINILAPPDGAAERCKCCHEPLDGAAAMHCNYQRRHRLDSAGRTWIEHDTPAPGEAQAAGEAEAVRAVFFAEIARHGWVAEIHPRVGYTLGGAEAISRAVVAAAALARPAPAPVAAPAAGETFAPCRLVARLADDLRRRGNDATDETRGAALHEAAEFVEALATHPALAARPAAVTEEMVTGLRVEAAYQAYITGGDDGPERMRAALLAFVRALAAGGARA